MNKRQVQFQALVLAGILAGTSLSFADAKPQTLKATALTQATKVEMKYTISGVVSAIDNNVLTMKTEDKLTYNVKLDKLSNLANFKEIAAKGSKIQVNCDLSKASLKLANVESVSIQASGSKENSKDTTLSTICIPAEAVKGSVSVAAKPSSVNLTKVVNLEGPISLDFAVSLEVEGKTFSFNQ